MRGNTDAGRYGRAHDHRHRHFACPVCGARTLPAAPERPAHPAFRWRRSPTIVVHTVLVDGRLNAMRCPVAGEGFPKKRRASVWFTITTPCPVAASSVPKVSLCDWSHTGGIEVSGGDRLVPEIAAPYVRAVLRQTDCRSSCSLRAAACQSLRRRSTPGRPRKRFTASLKYRATLSSLSSGPEP